jgi:cysteine desulfurase
VADTIYLDYQAATPIDPRVQAVMIASLSQDFANPSSSSHHLGWQAREKVERARAVIGRAIGADSEEVFFTSGATEADNLGVLGAALGAPKDRRRILVGATEHKAVIESALAARAFGFSVETIPVNPDGLIDTATLEAMVSADVAVLSVMAVNNEIGTIQDIGIVAELGARIGAFVHCDATQAPLAMPMNMTAWGVDAASFSSHKIYGPKGIGAIYLSSAAPWRPQPLHFGGGQENGLRPGTLPTPLCVAFAEAISIVATEGAVEREAVAGQRDRFADLLSNIAPSIIVTAADVQRHPGNLHVRFPGVAADDLLLRLQPMIAAATGSACTSGRIQSSHVLEAIGLSSDQAMEGVRFSIGRFTTNSEIDRATTLIGEAIDQIKTNQCETGA